MIGVAGIVAAILAIIAINVEVVVVRTVDPQQQLIANDRVNKAQASFRNGNATVNDALQQINEAKRLKTIGQANLDKANEAAKLARLEAANAAKEFDMTVQRKQQAQAENSIVREALKSANIAYRDALQNLERANIAGDLYKLDWDQDKTAALIKSDAAKTAIAEAIEATELAETAEQELREELQNEADAKELVATAAKEIATKALAKEDDARLAYEAARDHVGIVEQATATAAKDLAKKDAAQKTAVEEFVRANDALTAAGDKDNAAKIKLKRSDKHLNELNESFAISAAGWANEISRAETKLDEAKAALEIAKIESKDAAEFKNIVDRGVTDIVTTAVRSSLIGAAVGMVILLIQNFANAMRFYARITEFYNSQANALLAANGHSELSITYLREFPPKGIDFGKTPTSIYEKALDLVGKFGKSNPRDE